MIAQISMLDESNERTQYLERIERQYERFQPRLSAMHAEIQAYAEQRAAVEAARLRAAAAAVLQLRSQLPLLACAKARCSRKAAPRSVWMP